MSIVIDDKKITDINISNKNVQKIVDILTNKIIFEKTSSNEYFYIENTYDGSNTIFVVTIISSSNITGSHATQLQYSKDKETWTTITLSGTNTIPINSGERVYFRNDNGFFNWYESDSGLNTDYFYTQFTCTNPHKVGGNINSLLNYKDKNVTITPYCFYELFDGNKKLTDASELILPKTTLASDCYSSMFRGCTALTSTPKLPATTLVEGCYRSMFWGCTSLTTAPTLPATTLAESCYDSMFQNCTSLTTAPTLPATTLAESCYQYMFSGCTSLITAPELPATTLARFCYQNMFQGCTSLTTAPTELPATTLADLCYRFMFSDCTSLVNAPALPATTLAENCYESMFEGCTSLTTAPALPVKTLIRFCYSSMFKGCTSLTSAPALPATTLAYYCYQYMFSGCTSLTSAPALPAKTLAEYCYSYMFYGCTSLTKSPVLPATTLVDDCYEYMFYDCSSLNNVKSYAKKIGGGTRYTNMWLGNVAKYGTFYNYGSATYSRDASGIPTGWTEVKN